MRMSQFKGNIVKGPRTSSFLVFFGLLALIVSLPVMARPSYAASSVYISMGYSEKVVDSHTIIYVTITARDSQMPSQIVLTLVSYYNGSSTAFNAQKINSLRGNNGGVSHTFIVPFQEGGNYLFVGSIRDTHGSLLLQSKIDPFIEPEW